MYGAREDPSLLVRQLHDLAVSIGLAKRAGQTAAVRGLWEQFRAVAERYASIGAGERATLDFINRVEAGVQSFLRTAGEVGVQGVKLLASNVLIPLALIAGALYFGPTLLRRKRGG